MLAVATVFIGVWTTFDSQRRGGFNIDETKIPMQELELKVQGSLCARGGVVTGFYGTCIF